MAFLLLPYRRYCANIVDRERPLSQAALPLQSSLEGLGNPPDERKEGDRMYVTYSDLIQIGILIVALISLIYQIYKGKK